MGQPTTIQLQDGRRFEVARVSGYELEEGHVVVYEDGEHLRVRAIETVLGAGMIIFEGEDRVRQAPTYPMILMRQL